MSKEKKINRKWQPILSPLLASKVFLLISIFTPIFLILLDKSGIFSWRCPFYSLFKLYCPGCGMTRAGEALCQGDFYSAFLFHPFSLLFAFLWVFMLLLIFFPIGLRRIILEKLNYIELKFPLVPLLFLLFLFFGFARLIYQVYE